MPTATKSRRSYWAPVELGTSMLLIFPLLLLYQIGVLAIPSTYNGADFITAALLGLLHGNTAWYLALNGVLLLAFLITIVALRHRNALDGRLIVRVLVESTIYAVTMGSVIVLVMVDLLHISPQLALAAPTPAAEQGFIARIFLSLGAGVHEELIFRLAFLGMLIPLGERAFKLRHGVAVIIAFLISSVVFSAAHHIVGGEPWRVGVFVYRVFCGLIFASIFQLRGFAVAVYTHAFYDIYVLVIHG